jgi:SWI/SNF-related matrix-associated actin-dependent regulator of chromatin subfamily A-like protein 1
VESEKRPGELALLLDAIMLRRTLDEVGLQLPELYITTTPVIAVRTQALNDIEAELADNEDAQDTDPRLRQELGIAKVPATLELIADSITDTPTIIYAYHHAVLDALEEALEPFNPKRVDGTVYGNKRKIRIWNFQNERSNLFLGQITTCQTAITLSRAERVIIVEPSWTPDENLQAIKRAHRIGTRRPVRAEILVAKNTLDDGIQRRNRTKERLVNAALNPEVDFESLL